MKKVLTLCVIHQGDRVLLGMKKRGFGAGRWNGFGGKVLENEKIVDAAKRELAEEAGIHIRVPEKRGILEFEFEGDPHLLEVHVYGGNQFEGEPVETEEMKPQWFHVKEIPYDTMWPDDRYWFPYFLEGKNFRGRFIFQDVHTLVQHTLEEVHTF